MKKITGMVLAVIMILTAGMYVYAQDNITGELAAYGIMQGDPDGNFRLEDEISRAEMVKIIMEALGEKNIQPAQTVFSDVDTSHWASGYIAEAYEKGIVDGMGDGSFSPEGKVTNEQAVKMIVCALGYEPRTVHKGGWPYGYMVEASELGVLEGLIISGTQNALRGDIAVMMYNSLDIPVMRTVSGDEFTYTIMNGEKGVELITFRILQSE